MHDQRRPSTAARFGDVSRSEGRASAASVDLEQACVCGGLIVAASWARRDVMAAIACHQDSMLHMTWRYWNGLA